MENKERFRHIVTPLLYWYQGAKRDLPWREQGVTPYHVWISEIMLQQTRVEAVKGYYERFLNAFPDMESLANADDDVLNKVWQGLGYYSRARNMKKAAMLAVSQYGGELPCDYDALLKLPGIGAYTAGAIASIAFGLPTPAVDGNVLRVVTRLCLCADDITKPAVKEEVTEALRAVYPETKAEASAFTQALMELGATVCVPNGAPHCISCPLADSCLAHEAGRETDFPVKTPKRPRTIVDKTILLLRFGGAYAIRKRPERGLLAGLWEFPSEDFCMTEADVAAWLCQRGWMAESCVPLASAKHIFTHIEWHMTGYFCDVMPKDRTAEARGTTESDWIWASSASLAMEYAIPSAFRAYLKQIEAEASEVIDAKEHP